MKPTSNVNKTIALLVFLCAAVMTSVFVFRMSHKAPQVYSSNEGMVFSVPRAIKPFELVSADGNKFTQKNFHDHWTLLFFGFTHCSNICPTTMDMLKRSYEKLHGSYPNLQIVFISIDPERDSVEELNKYTHMYNENFVGVSGKIQDLRKLQSQLGVYSARDTSSSDSNYQIQHTSAIMLINPRGQWAGLFKFGITPEQFVQAFEGSVKSIS